MNKLLGFKNSLIVSMGVLIALCLLISNWMSFIQIRDSTIESVNETSTKVVQYEARKVETWFHSKAKVVEQLASNYQAGVYRDNFASYARLTKATSGVTDIFLGFENGSTYSTAVGAAWVDGVAKQDIYDPRIRPWYKQAREVKVVDITDVYADATTGNDVISIMKEMGDGVALVDIELTILAETIKSVTYLNSAAAITDGKGKVLASNTPRLKVGSRLSDLGLSSVEQSMLSQDQMMQEYSMDSGEQLAFSKAIQLVNGKKWYLLISVDKSLAYAALSEALNKALVSSVVMIAIAVALLLTLLHILYRPILLLKEVVTDLSKGSGDLTRRLPVSSQDDLGEISEGINQFISKLQVMMREVLQSSDLITASVDRLKIETDSNSQILVAHTTETEQIVTAIEEMSATANDVARNGAETAAFTQTTNEQAMASKRVVGEATETVARLVREMDNTASNITDIDRDTIDITNVLKVIGDIAEQTNLLALNAAIEAARAGEQGRGFAVVADEVRALAARTQTSTAEIERTLAKLRKGSTAAIDAMEVTKGTCLKTAEATEMVASDLDAISISVNQINDLNTQIATAAEEQSSVSGEITRNMAAISEMANELSINGQTSLKQTLNLDHANQQLRAVVGRFKLE
ncbi:methyl-accepting chemotaxis protein [Shewanella sp. SR44-3]|uniref:methyl-accepting chemotaxis protein n=1 Tax=Shewanella sp. SR44-3 TaxID=2760936 RepID=UPI00287350AD|nr:methyl-accepting chemotaxis protein [Shewanella sp. SR44-3]